MIIYNFKKKKINQKKRFISKNITNKFPDQKYYFAEIYR